MHRAGEGLPNNWRTTATFRSCVLALSLLLPGPVFAAGLTCPQPVASNVPGSEKQSALDELDEVVVNGGKATDSTADLRAWLKRLVGQYTYEGHVDLCGKGNAVDQRPVTGKADCIGFGAAPNVQCAINVRWPEVRGDNGSPLMGGVSNLSPAMVVYGLEGQWLSRNQTHKWGVMFLQVDNKGVAERASGVLVGDTLTSRAPCVGMPGSCRKITRITAKPDSNDISMLVDFEIDHQQVLRHVFVLHRVSNIQKGERTGASSP